MNFTNGAELLEYCEKENKKISEALFERETTFLEQDPEADYNGIRRINALDWMMGTVE